MNKIEKIIREFTVPIIAGVLVAVLTLLVLVPRTKEIFTLRKEISKQKAQIEKLLQKLADLKSLSEADLQTSADLVLRTLPVTQDPLVALSLGEKIFQDNGILLESFKFLNPVASTSGTNENEVSPLGISFSFSTTFENFKEMIKQTESILPLIKLEGMKFGPVEASESAYMPNLSGRISFISFFAPLPKNIGKIDADVPKVSSKDKEFIDKLKEYHTVSLESFEEINFYTPGGKENPFAF